MWSCDLFAVIANFSYLSYWLICMNFTLEVELLLTPASIDFSATTVAHNVDIRSIRRWKVVGKTVAYLHIKQTQSNSFNGMFTLL